jgi:hypothetical protein
LIAFALLNGRRGRQDQLAPPACTDSISLTRSLSGNAVIIPVIGLKIGVCARQKSSKSEKVRVTSIVVVVISSKPSRANNELSALRLKSPVPGTRGPPADLAHLQGSKGAPGRGLVRLRFDQRRKRAGPILSGRVGPSLRLGAAFLHAEPEMFRRTFATIAALNARAFFLG